MTALGIAFALFLALGVPIAFALGLAGVIALWFVDFRLLTVPARMFTSIDSFVLLAAPFYILAGDLMNRGGLTERLILLSQWLVGRIRGGTAYANIVASVFFSGISGTAIADIAALGQVFIHGMPKEGYSKSFAAAVTLASAMIGPIIPPSVVMVIYAAVAGVSVVDMFLAGIVPGLMLALACAVIVAWHAMRGELPQSTLRLGRDEKQKLLREGLFVSSLPAFIVIGSVSGVFTPTEAGGMAVLYALFMGCVVFRHLTWSGLWAALKDTSRTTATLFLVVAGASVCSYVLTVLGVANFTRGFAVTFADNPQLFLWTVLVLLTLVGCFLDPGAAIIIFVPLLMPVVRQLGIDELQFSMIFILTGTLGLMTPPVGVCLFAAARIGNMPVWSLFRATFPFFVAETLVIVLIILFPDLASFLPRWIRG